MIPKDPNHNYTMGSRLVSFYDIAMINEFYECYGSPIRAKWSNSLQFQPVKRLQPQQTARTVGTPTLETVLSVTVQGDMVETIVL